MLRFLLSAFSVLALLITTTMLPRSAFARRCSVKMPVTLLSLYRTSDAIYVGRYEKTEDGEVKEETPDYKVVPITKHFSISSALKGEPRKMLTLEDSDYRYKEQEKTGDDEAEEEESDTDGEDPLELKAGDSVLLFVTRAEEGDGVDLTDYSDGIKKMTPDKLAAYEARIRELNGMFDAKKPTYVQLIDWLVRCAQDPETRWEGTYELVRSFQTMEWRDEQAKRAKEKPESEQTESTTADEEHEIDSSGPKDFETGDPEFARNVSEKEKNALTNILLSRKVVRETEDGDKPEVTSGDSQLIDLVKRWGDSSVATRLIEQLRASSSDPDFTADLMASIASMFKDPELEGISRDYSDIQWEAAVDLVDADEEESAEGEDPQPSAGASSAVPADDPTSLPVSADGITPLEPAEVEVPEVEGENIAEKETAGAEKPKKKTYADLRNELLQEFLERADKVIEKERNKKTAKLNR